MKIRAALVKKPRADRPRYWWFFLFVGVRMMVPCSRPRVSGAIVMGMIMAGLDTLGNGLLERFGARSAPGATYGFPGRPAPASTKRSRMAFRSRSPGAGPHDSRSRVRQGVCA